MEYERRFFYLGLIEAMDLEKKKRADKLNKKQGRRGRRKRRRKR